MARRDAPSLNWEQGKVSVLRGRFTVDCTHSTTEIHNLTCAKWLKHVSFPSQEYCYIIAIKWHKSGDLTTRGSQDRSEVRWSNRWVNTIVSVHAQEKKCPTLAHSDDLKEINLHLFFSFQIRERGRQKLFNPGKSQKCPLLPVLLRNAF